MPWSGLANVSDYDLVLVNLLKLKEESARKQVDGVKFQSLLDFTVTPDVLIHSGHIVILGDPRFSIPDWRSEGEE